MSPLKKTALKYGALCGIVLIASYLLQTIVGNIAVLDVKAFFVYLIVYFGFIFFAGKEFKEYKNGGTFHFWQGISIGILIILISVVIFSLFSATYYVLNESAFQEHVNDSVNYLLSIRDTALKELPEEVVQEQIANIRQLTVWQLILDRAIKQSGIGFLITPVVSIILRTRNY